MFVLVTAPAPSIFESKAGAGKLASVYAAENNFWSSRKVQSMHKTTF